ncbi:MAG: IPT/TIG domain-containing protein [Nitrospira sp.]|nr:IPT/TIG domain-containing protein [Nitrospira sp.]
MKSIARVIIGVILLASPVLAEQAQAEAPALHPNAAVPGSTLSITGKGFGPFKSTRFNQVTFHGAAALIQRWEPDIIEVRVPSLATNGPVEVIIGRKHLKTGAFTRLQPTIQAVMPEEAEPGTVLEITGEHFGNTAGPRDPNTIFGVNSVVVGDVTVRVRKWRDEKIEVELPANVQTGDVVIRMASSDPLADGSCCAPVRHVVSNAMPIRVLASVRVDPVSGPVGTKVVLFGNGFGTMRNPEDGVSFGGRLATVSQWNDTAIVVHVPLDAQSGPVVMKRNGQERTVGTYTVQTPRATGLTPSQAPIGTLLKITGDNFGFYSEAGATPYNYLDFSLSENTVEIGGVPAIVYRWGNDRIDVWVPYSAESGPVVVKRAATTPKPDGTCCADRRLLETEIGMFTLAVPKIDSYNPASGGLDDVVTITGSGFGKFLKTAEASKVITDNVYARTAPELGENVSRTEVLFNGVGAIVLSWTDSEIKVRIPHRNVYGVGKAGEFNPDLSSGPLVVRRGSWDLLPDGSCCTAKKWITLEAGTFMINSTGLPDASYWRNPSSENTHHQQ